MEKFEDVVTSETPRIVVMFRYEGGTEHFQWGIVGEIPRITALGALTRVQSELYYKAAKICPALALVITYNPSIKKIDWFIHPDAPIDPIVGMLETIKFAILSAQQPNKSSILGPDGLAIRNGISR